VQILLLVTKESVEHRILELHDTKRNVLDNVWAGEGEDVIAAPGGSGAFKQMLEALLRTRGPEPAQDAGDAVEVGALEVEAAAVPEPEPAQETPVPQAPEDDVPSAGRPERPAAVDAEALAQAVAAVAPALPKEHRRSLALVFRALADVLEGDV